MELECSSKQQTGDNTVIKTSYPYRRQKFKESWTAEYKFIVSDGTSHGKKCTVCNIGITGSKSHIKRHMASDFHKKRLKAKKNSVKIDSFVAPGCEEQRTNESAKKLEIALSLFIAEHNLPFASLDHLNHLLKKYLILKLLKACI